MARSHFTTWLAHRKGRELAGSIYRLTQTFPAEEKYGLTDQIKRCSWSVCANLAESFAKRRYPKHFIAKITDSAGENYETQSWLMCALDRGYISESHYRQYMEASERVGRLLTYMEYHHDQFTLRAPPK